MQTEILEHKRFIRLSNQLFQYTLDGYKEVIKYSNLVNEIKTRHKSKRPFHLNVIEAVCHGQFKETGHSLVLGNMLNYPSIQSSFLEKFLGINHNDLEVRIEKDDIDIALKSKEILVIIENKVNSARERPQQIFRYVHDIGMKEYGFDKSQIYVLYLNPYNRKHPSKYSLCDKNNENNVFDFIGKDHYNVISYKYDITDWLRNISINDEPHIASALDQYVDYLEQKFENSQLDKEMNNEIKDFLLKELLIEGKTFEEQMSSLDNQRVKVYDLLNKIDEVKIDLQLEHSLKLIRKWQEEIEQKIDVKLCHDEHSFGIQLKNEVWLGVWDGHDNGGDDYRPYWGFQSDKYKKDPNSEIYKTILNIINKASIGDYDDNEKNNWVAWESISGNGANIFLSLYNSAKELGLI